MTNVLVPEHLRALCLTLQASAEAVGIEAYLVGGSVRDLLIGRELRDFDVAVSGDALSWAQGVAETLGASFVPLDEENGVARLVLHGSDVEHVDVAQLQGTIEQDLARRDFTVNALAAPLVGGEVLDIRGGLADLDAKRLRADASAFKEDPLRLLRGVRLAGELGFALERETRNAIRQVVPRFWESSVERVRDELMRIFSLERAYPSMRLLDELGLLAVIFPELMEGKGVAQPDDHHSYDVLDHNLHTVEALDAMLAPRPPPYEAGDLWNATWYAFGWCESQLRDHFTDHAASERSRGALLKLAGLLHDIGKPMTRSVETSGRIRFFGHADAGADVSGRLLRRLRFSTREIRYVRRLVSEHLRPVQLARVGEAPTRRALYRFYRDVGEALPALLFLALADGAASRGRRLTIEGWSRQALYMNGLLVRSLGDEGIVSPPRLLTGRDIMSELGVPAGPQIGRLLAALAEAQGAGEVRDRDEAVAFVRSVARREAGG